ncbi:MAG TPA: M48 family peptidase, partial [Azonexus sp.]|nr:M48 family peptidase [Azonexus sp.]
MTENFTLLFLAAFTLTLAARLWLKLRQIRHVAAHRGTVPTEFAERISLASHQKAAAYTIDRSRTAILGTLSEAVLLLA